MLNDNDFNIEYYKEECYYNSQSKLYKNLLMKTEDIIKRFLDLDVKTTVNLSGGKDSVVMSHFVAKIKPDIKIVSEKDDMDFPEELDYIQSLQKRYKWNMDILQPEVKLWDIITNHDITQDLHSKNTEFSGEYFYKLLKEYQKANNVKGVFLGLRNQESKGRFMNFKVKSQIYYNKDWSTLICTPLSLWSAKDIFTYLFANDIPVMSVYFKTQFIGHPEKIRKSWILPSSQTNEGQALWLKYYYPDIFNKLSQIKPELRAFV